MPDVPPDVAIKATIRPGSVYYFRHESFQHSKDPHYFIVINLNPINETVIFLVNSMTSKFSVNQRRSSFPSETLVTVTPTTYSGFPLTSIIDCNSVTLETLQGLIQKLKNKQLQLKPEMDISVVEKLRKGVLTSPTIPRNVKDQLKENKNIS